MQGALKFWQQMQLWDGHEERAMGLGGRHRRTYGNTHFEAYAHSSQLNNSEAARLPNASTLRFFTSCAVVCKCDICTAKMRLHITNIVSSQKSIQLTDLGTAIVIRLMLLRRNRHPTLVECHLNFPPACRVYSLVQRGGADLHLLEHVLRGTLSKKRKTVWDEKKRRH